MTDPDAPDAPGSLPDADPVDELASALHDGEATDDERAREAEPAVVVARRVVDAVAARVADVPPAPPGLADRHVAAALEVAGGGAGSGETEGAGSGAAVVPLAGRRPWTQRVPLGAVAAAVAVVALVGALGLARGGDDPPEDTATAALEADDAGDAGEAGTLDDAGAAAGGSTLAAGERQAYGSYEELAAALAGQVPPEGGDDAPMAADAGEATTTAAPAEESGAESTERSVAAGCDAVAAAGLAPEQVRLVSPVLVADRLVTAVVHRDGDELRLTVVDDGTCAVVEERSLAG